jgi:hypothetical protein
LRSKSATLGDDFLAAKENEEEEGDDVEVEVTPLSRRERKRFGHFHRATCQHSRIEAPIAPATK